MIILAIAFLAVMETTQSGIRATAHVSRSLAADWVAMNIMSELQAGIRTAPKPGAALTGTMPMLNQNWQWRATAINSNLPSPYSAVRITVGQRNQSYQTITGYIQEHDNDSF